MTNSISSSSFIYNAHRSLNQYSLQLLATANVAPSYLDKHHDHHQLDEFIARINHCLACLSKLNIYQSSSASPPDSDLIGHFSHLLNQVLHLHGQAELLSSHVIDTQSRKWIHFNTLIWLFLTQWTNVVYCFLLNSILNYTLIVQREQIYWHEVPYPWFFFISIPNRLFSLFQKSTYSSMKSKLADQLVAFKSFDLTSPNRNRISNYLPFRFVHSNIVGHSSALHSYKHLLAKQIGMLYHHSIHLNEHPTTIQQASTDPFAHIQGHVSQLLDTINSVLLDTQPLNHVPISPLLNPTTTIPSAPNTINQLLNLTSRLKTPGTSTSKILNLHARPSLITRWWIPVLSTAVLSTYTMQQVKGNYTSIMDTLESSVALISHGLQDWILRPLVEMYETIRHREHRLILMGKQSVHADLESLERMVLSYATTANEHVDMDQVQALVQHGDLGFIMRHYEECIQSPIKSMVLGPLLTLMLIQVQKSKVDLELAMSALDKLLKSNELNFGLLALFPALSVLYFGFLKVQHWVGVRNSVSVRRSRRRFLNGIWTIERILIVDDLDCNHFLVGIQSTLNHEQSKHSVIERLDTGASFSDQSAKRPCVDSNLKLGLALIEINYLKHLVTYKMGLPNDVRTMLLTELHDIEDTDPAALNEIERAIDRIHRLIVKYQLVATG